MSRGERNNNPGNIRRMPGVRWEGQAADQSKDPAFVVFNGPEWGIRAIARILRSYARQGLNTVHGIINRWAPPNENNSEAYVDAVCRDCMVLPDQTIDVEENMPALIRAIIIHENGRCIYSTALIESGISLA